jgi:hypothetical protein
MMGRRAVKNKTIATWLALVGGPLGLHRFYLRGMRDSLGWALPIPSALGLYGVWRVQRLGVDDPLSWVLLPILGFTLAGCALNAIVYGLMAAHDWNAKFNPGDDPENMPGQTNWLTVGAVVLALLFGTTELISAIAFSMQRYFEYQILQPG